MQLYALQIVVAQDTISVSSNSENPDTIIIQTQPRIRGRNVVDITNDSIPIQINSIVKRKGDPMKASMISAVFPGGGQIYNRKYWKLPIVYGGFGALFYMFKTNSDNYQMYYKGYVDFTDNIPETRSYEKFMPVGPDFDPALITPARARSLEDQMIRFIDYHKRYRDLSIILAGVWYFAQILDANVDASLMDYDVSDNLELSFVPKMFNIPGMQPIAGMSLRFTINF